MNIKFVNILKVLLLFLVVFLRAYSSLYAGLKITNITQDNKSFVLILNDDIKLNIF
jgi:hypothetical protein